MRRLTARFAIFVAIVVGVGGVATFAAGCGPIEYIATVPLDAAGALAEAKHSGGEKYAPYEMTAAQEYIHKSRELAGYARFQSSVDFGRKAAENAKKARIIAADKSKLPEAHESPAVQGGAGAQSPTDTTTPTEVQTITPAAPSENPSK